MKSVHVTSPLRTAVFAFLFLSLWLLTASTNPSWAADLPGSKDHPLLKRFGGSEIVAYDSKRFVEYELQTSTFTSFDLEAHKRRYATPPLALGGALTRIWY